MLPLWWEHSFDRSDPPKIGPESDSEPQRREKTQKIGSGAVSGRTFSLPVPFLIDLGVPSGGQNGSTNRPPGYVPVVFFRPKIDFLRFLRSDAFRKAPGPLLEAPGTLPSTIPEGFCNVCRRGPSASCRSFLWGVFGAAG